MQRWPAVPTAPNSDGAQRQVQVGVVHHDDGVVAAQLQERAAQPSAPRVSATCRPIAVEPVKRDQRHARGRRPGARRRSAPPPMTRLKIAGAAVRPRAPRLQMLLHGDGAMSGVSGEGFQSTQSPHTAAIMAFQAQTATGKLKAVMTPTDAQRMPLLVHAVAAAARSAWSGRRAGATGRRRSRAMSIISCTSPRPSARILPISSVTSAPSSSLCSRSSLADLAHDLAALRRRPVRHSRKASAGRGHPLVVLGAGHAHARDRLAGGGVDRLQPLAVGRDPLAVKGAGTLGLDAERIEDSGNAAHGIYGHRISPGRFARSDVYRPTRQDNASPTMPHDVRPSSALLLALFGAWCGTFAWGASSPASAAAALALLGSLLWIGPPGAIPCGWAPPGACCPRRSGSPWRRAAGPRRCRGRAG